MAAEPAFTNPTAGNFYLQPQSAAVNAGDPDSTFNDPDGTRADLGAFSLNSNDDFWWQNNFPPQYTLEEIQQGTIP